MKTSKRKTHRRRIAMLLALLVFFVGNVTAVLATAQGQIAEEYPPLSGLPQTGDMEHPVVLIVLFCVSFIGISTMLLTGEKKRRVYPKRLEP